MKGCADLVVNPKGGVCGHGVNHFLRHDGNMTERSVLFSGREWVCTSREGLVWHWRRRANGSNVGAVFRDAQGTWRMVLVLDFSVSEFASLGAAARCLERHA